MHSNEAEYRIHPYNNSMGVKVTETPHGKAIAKSISKSKECKAWDLVISKAEEVKKLREDCGLSCRTFGDMFMVGDSTVRNWESGERNPITIYNVLMMKLRKKIDKIENKENIARTIRSKITFYGISGFMEWLYSNENS